MTGIYEAIHEIIKALNEVKKKKMELLLLFIIIIIIFFFFIGE